jgi:hypothetical protein
MIAAMLGPIAACFDVAENLDLFSLTRADANAPPLFLARFFAWSRRHPQLRPAQGVSAHDKVEMANLNCKRATQSNR